MTPYYEKDGKCECGCGSTIVAPRRFVSGHNLTGIERTESYRKAIAEGQRRAWQTKRERLPVGSKYISQDGYIIVKIVPGKGVWRAEHLIVMEEILGRKLTKPEVVHHVNGDRADNHPSNLFLCRDRAHHNEVHRSQDAALRSLLKAGKVLFQEGQYEAVL